MCCGKSRNSWEKKFVSTIVGRILTLLSFRLEMRTRGTLFTSSSRFGITYWKVCTRGRTSWYSRKFSRLVNADKNKVSRCVLVHWWREQEATGAAKLSWKGWGIKFIIEFATVSRWLLIFINIHITVHVVYNINFATFLSTIYHLNFILHS